MQQWMRKVNPHALESIVGRLLEAIQRGMWQAPDEMSERLRQLYLDLEGDIEDRSE